MKRFEIWFMYVVFIQKYNSLFLGLNLPALYISLGPFKTINHLFKYFSAYSVENEPNLKYISNPNWIVVAADFLFILHQFIQVLVEFSCAN